MATRKKLTLDLLDSINVAAIAYAAALWALSRLMGNDYLVFPIQIVIVINIGYIWSLFGSILGSGKTSSAHSLFP